MRKLKVAVALVLACLAVGLPAAQAPAPRVLAVGDIHGALDAFVEILQQARLLDANRKWVGGTATLVQTGDYTDRGAGVRAVMDLLMELEPQAAAARGRVITLLGNHEVMNLIGELRDVTPAIFATFADAQSEARRERAYREYVALAEARAKARPVVPAVYAVPREAWLAAHPPGWIEYREAFGPKGRYGSWLRKRKVSAVVDGTLFMHAGPDPATDVPIPQMESLVAEELERVDRFYQQLVDERLALPFFTLNEMLQVAAAEIRAVNAIAAAAKEKGEAANFAGFDLAVLREAAEVVTIGDWSLLSENGPLWYRGYAAAPEATLREPVAAFLTRNAIERIVVAHTPQQTRRITTRLAGSVVLIDTGMLTSAYKGRASALEITGGQLAAIYADGKIPLTASPQLEVGLQRQRE
jgi:Calcineurin-like phosphoesterase